MERWHGDTRTEAGTGLQQTRTLQSSGAMGTLRTTPDSVDWARIELLGWAASSPRETGGSVTPCTYVSEQLAPA